MSGSHLEDASLPTSGSGLQQSQNNNVIAGERVEEKAHSMRNTIPVPSDP